MARYGNVLLRDVALAILGGLSKLGCFFNSQCRTSIFSIRRGEFRRYHRLDPRLNASVAVEFLDADALTVLHLQGVLRVQRLV